jgi:acetone carboxylase gamma subunit
MCGGTMQLSSREEITHMSGASETRRHQVREWTCPECDYFEEAVEDDG